MHSEWDMPRPATEHFDARVSNDANAMPGDGFLDPMALMAVLARNLVRIGLIAAVLTALGVAALIFYPFPYKATAIVIADPRDQRVTLQEDVLPAIGADAAVLESMVQIVKSDGFLLAAMQDLDLIGDRESMSQTERLKALGKFRKRLTAERKGATYLVEISYSASDPDEAARIANGIADAFAESQNQSRSTATENAAKSLAKRLVELRATLNASEEAVAEFKAANGIIFVDQGNTLQMRQLTELSQQLALAKNATEEARARYEELKNGGSISISAQQTGEGGQLAFLRQQRSELAQSLQQQRQTYGPRHPRILQTQQMLRGMDAQIATERQLLERQLKATLDVAASKQAELERQITSLSSGVNFTEAAQVKLDALEREASANREIYQQFLARNKQTDELALLVEDNVRIVSNAVPPLRSTRPSLTLAGPAIAVLSLVVATVVSVGRNFGSVIAAGPIDHASRPARPAERPVETRYAFRQPVGRSRPDPAREPVSLLDGWGDIAEDGPVQARLLRAQRERMLDARPPARGGWRRAG